jgi:6-phosphofructokinase
VYYRSVPANAADALYCILLGQNAVHGAMAGYTNFSTGLVNNRVVYIPIPRIVATSPRGVDPNGRTWERVLSNTRQPQALRNEPLNVPVVTKEDALLISAETVRQRSQTTNEVDS